RPSCRSGEPRVGGAGGKEGRARQPGQRTTSKLGYRRREMRKRSAVMLIGVVFLVAFGASGALAVGSWHTLSDSTTGGSFSGNWRWYANGESCGSGCYGGWERAGTIKDTNCGDGNNMFDEARVEGYGWSQRFYGTQCGN